MCDPVISHRTQAWFEADILDHCFPRSDHRLYYIIDHFSTSRNLLPFGIILVYQRHNSFILLSTLDPFASIASFWGRFEDATMFLSIQLHSLAREIPCKPRYGGGDVTLENTLWWRVASGYLSVAVKYKTLDSRGWIVKVIFPKVSHTLVCQ